MNNTTPIGPRDRPERMNGDRGWLGVNLKLDPSQLPEGYASEAVNMRFRLGVPETRGGSMVAPWLNKISGGAVQPWGAVYGVGVFRDPNSAQEYVLLAADGNVYACQPNNAPMLLRLPSGVTVATSCRFQQAFDVVILFRGFDATPLVMSSVVTGFLEIEASPNGTGLLNIPNAMRSVAAANRVFVANDGDGLLASDILDYTHYSLTDNFRINQGSADRIVNVSTFGSSTIVALKGLSIYRVDSVYGTLSAATLSTVTTRYGCVAAESVVDCGNDLLWLSQEGVASLTLTERNEIQTAQGALAGKYPMFSDDIQPLIERIAWRYASGATAQLWNDYYILAVPIDQAEVLGPELSPQNWAAPSNSVRIPTTAGATYRWLPTATETLLTNGAATYATSRDFVAEAAYVTVTISGLTFNGSLRQVWAGVNNAVLVYDLRNQAWAGYDHADGIAYSRFFKARYNHRERLFGLTFDGYVRLFEEDQADRLSQPYVDVVVTDPPEAGDSIQVNGGTTVTAYGFDFNGTGGQWGINGIGLNTPAANLFTDGTYGYYAGSSSEVWSAPNTITVKIENGVRFISTNGVLPDVDVAGDWAAVLYVTEEDVDTVFTTRGYRSQDGALSKFNSAAMDVQTRNPNLSMTLIGDGVNEEEQLVEDSDRDPTKYTRIDLADYDLSNTGNNFYQAYREDYSITPTGVGFAFTPGDNVYGHLHQESREQYPANTLGRSGRVRLTNNRGRIRIMQCSVDMVPQPAPAGSTS